MNNNRPSTILASLALIIALAAVIIQFNSTSQHIGYVDLNLAFAEFNYTKEYSEKLQHIETRQKIDLDSLKTKLEIASLDKSNNPRSLEQMYYSKVEELSERKATFKAESEAKIWNQINTYAQEFGQNHNLKLLLGANGTGGIMYGDTTLDKTKEFIRFINQSFSDNL